MPNLRGKYYALLAKVETTAGVDASPAAADAVRVANCRFAPNPDNTEVAETTGTLDAAAPVVGGMRSTLTFDVIMKGSGAAATAPEWGKLLRACGWSETIQATPIPATAEACGTGASTTAATLGTTAAGTAGLYRGAPIQFTGAVAAVSQIAEYSAAKLASLTDTAAAAITATTNYQILPHVRYTPVSAANTTALTLYYFKDGVRWRLTGCQGTVRFQVTAGGFVTASFVFSGVFVDRADAAIPANLVFDTPSKPIWKDGAALYNRKKLQMSSLTLDMGGQVTFPPDPNQAPGYGLPIVTERRPRGSMSAMDDLTASQTALADALSQTPRVLAARLGATAGNRLALMVPGALMLNETEGDMQGLASVDVPFAATGSDAWAYLVQF